ncbi:invasion associated locus B family protein, partial [Mesorhizobium sp. M8A.F.Ca.ET.059.01.1.1]
MTVALARANISGLAVGIVALWLILSVAGPALAEDAAKPE